MGGVPYNDKLLDAYVSRYGQSPEEGIERLRELCKRGVHIWQCEYGDLRSMWQQFELNTLIFGQFDSTAKF